MPSLYTSSITEVVFLYVYGMYDFLRTTNLVRCNNQFPRKLGSYQTFAFVFSFAFFFSCRCYDKGYKRIEQHPENKGNYPEASSLEEGNKTRSVKESRYHTVCFMDMMTGDPA